MRIAVLSNLESWYYRDLLRASTGRCELVLASHSSLAAWLDGQHAACRSGDVDLTCCDAVLVRTMPPGSLEQVVFRMDVLGRLAAAGTYVLNPPRALEAAVDKYLTTARLQAAGLRQPETFVCQSAEQAMVGWERLGGDVVVKPLFGSEGRGITRVSDPDLALRAFRMLEQLGAVLYLQRFVPHGGADWRLFVLGEQIWGMKRTNTGDWRTNVSRGARTEPLEVTAELADLARRATEVLGTPLAGVDVLPGLDGQLYVLEVNAVPGWRALARTLHRDIAGAVLDLVIREVESRGRPTGANRD